MRHHYARASPDTASARCLQGVRAEKGLAGWAPCGAPRDPHRLAEPALERKERPKMPILPLGLKRLYNKRLRDHARTATPRETVRASVEVRGAELTVRFGNRGFFLRAPAPIETAETIPDCAVLGLAIQSMSHNIEIHLDQTVTPAAAGILDRLGYANHLWMMPGNAPLRLRHEVGAPAPCPPRARTRSCASAAGSTAPRRVSRRSPITAIPTACWSRGRITRAPASRGSSI